MQEQTRKRSGKVVSSQVRPCDTFVTTPDGFWVYAFDPLQRLPRLFQLLPGMMWPMKKYAPERWAALGQWVHDARMQVDGLRDMEAWAAAVGRSTRQLAGLERGESVGVGTLERVADALGVDQAMLFRVLTDEGQTRGQPKVAGSDLSDAELIAILAYRLGRRGQQEGGTSHGEAPEKIHDATRVDKEEVNLTPPGLVADSEPQPIHDQSD